jgi:hypothetical protein
VITRLHAVALAALSDGPGPQKNLITEVERAMKTGGQLTSLSGRTAALAINWCERNNTDYSLTRIDGRYYFKKKD